MERIYVHVLLRVTFQSKSIEAKDIVIILSYLLKLWFHQFCCNNLKVFKGLFFYNLWVLTHANFVFVWCMLFFPTFSHHLESLSIYVRLIFYSVCVCVRGWRSIENIVRFGILQKNHLSLQQSTVVKESHLLLSSILLRNCLLIMLFLKFWELSTINYHSKAGLGGERKLFPGCL